MPSRPEVDRDRKRQRRANEPEWHENEKKRRREHYQRHAEHLKEIARHRYANDPSYQAQTRKSARYRQTGWTDEQYQEALKFQRGCCAICSDWYGETLCADHCHKTKARRALLCSACNLGLGKFKDNAGLLEEAARYVRSFEDRKE